MIGKTFGHCHTTEKLGEGRMVEVYRAEETNLRCQVTIKVLPDESTLRSDCFMNKVMLLPREESLRR